MNQIVFVVEGASEGGYTARALRASIFTQADTVSELHERVQDAVRCHFNAQNDPASIRLRFVG
jgi:hypothetical protein